MPAQEHTGGETDHALNMPENTKGYNIILLDDDRFLLDMYSTKFSREGHNVIACLSVDEVLKALHRGFNPDAIVFDLVMPGKDGFELLQMLNKERLAKDALKLVLTNQGEDEERKKTEQLGADAYIVKANTIPSEVVNKITSMIRARKGA